MTQRDILEVNGALFVTALEKGGVGSGNYGHSGRIGERGGSGGGSLGGGGGSAHKEDLDDRRLLMLGSNEKFLDMPVKPVKAIKSNATFGQCTQNTLAEWKKNGGDVYVGTAVDVSSGSRYQEALARFKETGGDDIWTTQSIPHAWNVQDGQIVDYTLGKEAADYKYFGIKVPKNVLARTTPDGLAEWHSDNLGEQA